MADAKINDIISSGLEVKGLGLLDIKSSVRSLSDADDFSTEEMYHFLMNLKNILESLNTGFENFSGKFLPPHFENVQLEELIYGLFAIEREETTKKKFFLLYKLKFIF